MDLYTCTERMTGIACLTYATGIQVFSLIYIMDFCFIGRVTRKPDDNRTSRTGGQWQQKWNRTGSNSVAESEKTERVLA